MGVLRKAEHSSLVFRAELADSLYSEEIERKRWQDQARINDASIDYAYRLLEDLETREESDGEAGL